MEQQSKDPLHGKRLDAILEELVEYYHGFEELGKQINIKCFTDNPSKFVSEISEKNALGKNEGGESVSVCFKAKEKAG